MTNIIQQQEMLKDLSDENIAQEMQQPSGQVPLYLVSGEAKRRADLRERFKAEQAGPPPATTVQQDLLNSIMASQMQGTGIAQGVGRQQPQPQIQPTGEAPAPMPQQAQGIMAGQQSQMLPGNTQGFAGGGLVQKYADGGGVWNDPFAPGGIYYQAPVARRDSGGYKAMADHLAAKRRHISKYQSEQQQKRDTALYENAVGFTHANTDDYSYGELNPMQIRQNPRHTSGIGGIMTSNLNDPVSPPLEDETGPLTLSPDISGLTGEGITVNIPSAPVQTYEDIARGNVIRHYQSTTPKMGALKKPVPELDLSGIDRSNEQRKYIDPTITPEGEYPTYKPRDFDASKLKDYQHNVDVNKTAADRLRDLRNEDNPYAHLRAKLEEDEASTAAFSDKRVGMALLTAGLAIAGGKSQHAMVNIGEGGQKGVKEYVESGKELEKRKSRNFANRTAITTAEEQRDKDLKAEADRYAQNVLKQEEMANKLIDQHNARYKYSENIAREQNRYRHTAAAAMYEHNTELAKYNTTALINEESRRVNDAVRHNDNLRADLEAEWRNATAARKEEIQLMLAKLEGERWALTWKGKGLENELNRIVAEKEAKAKLKAEKENLQTRITATASEGDKTRASNEKIAQTKANNAAEILGQKTRRADRIAVGKIVEKARAGEPGIGDMALTRGADGKTISVSQALNSGNPRLEQQAKAFIAQQMAQDRNPSSVLNTIPRRSLGKLSGNKYTPGG